VDEKRTKRTGDSEPTDDIARGRPKARRKVSRPIPLSSLPALLPRGDDSDSSDDDYVKEVRHQKPCIDSRPGRRREATITEPVKETGRSRPPLPPDVPALLAQGHSSNDSDSSPDEAVTDEFEKASRSRKAERRNKERVKVRDKMDGETICKYLPQDIDDILGPGIQGDDDYFVPPDWLMEAIELNLGEEVVPVPKTSEIRFDTSEASLEFNSNLLGQYDYDFEKLLARNKGTTIDFGSEFRPIPSLRRILGEHTNFEFFAKILSDGMPYVFTRELSEEERIQELEANITRGNHKSANDAPDEAKRLLGKDVTHGFSFPILPESSPRSRGHLCSPAGW
jgi:hypothetical protein